ARKGNAACKHEFTGNVPGARSKRRISLCDLDEVVRARSVEELSWSNRETSAGGRQTGNGQELVFDRIPVAVHVEHASHILERMTRWRLDTQFLSELIVFFVADEVDDIVFVERKIIQHVEIIVDVGRLGDQRVIPDLKLALEAAHVR